jgi:membrane-anchored mycosin MYCP
MERIKRTAQTPETGPNAATGYGVIDPIAALTYDLPPAAKMPAPFAGQSISGPGEPIKANTRARDIVLMVVGMCVAIAAIAVVVVKSRGGGRT